MKLPSIILLPEDIDFHHLQSSHERLASILKGVASVVGGVVV